MDRMHGSIAAVLLLVSLGATSAAEPPRDVRVTARTSPDSLTVGDRLTLEVSVDAPPGSEVRFPDRVEPGGPVELVALQVDTPEARKKQKSATAAPGVWVGRYTLAVFRVGEVVLPPWQVEVHRGSERATAATDSIRFFVSTVLTDSLRQAKLRDIKGQMELSVIPWLWIAIGLAIVALVVFLLWRRRRRPRATVVPIERVRPAHELALEALRRLDSQRLPVDGKFEAYYVRISEILRRYLEDGFGVAALEETTEEILFDLDRRGFDRTTLKQVGALCGESDLVKFAKHEPTIQECTESMTRVRDFVLATAARSSASGVEPPASTGTAGPIAGATRPRPGRSGSRRRGGA